MKKKIFTILLSLAFVFLPVMPISADQTTSVISRSAAGYYASQYNWHGLVTNGNTGTGSQTVTLGPSLVQLNDGRAMQPFGAASNLLTPVTFDMGANQETVTPTAVSSASCPTTGQFSASAQCISFTGSFTFAHGTNTFITSGSVGLQEAIDDAFAGGGGQVVVDSSWPGTNAMLVAAIPYQTVYIADFRAGGVQYWTPIGAAAAIATPTTLVAATAGFGVNGADFASGAYTGSNTYITCISYVDIMGQEGPCSATFTVATSGALTTDQIGFTAPAASAGAVGYTIYITLTGGAYTSSYKVPLVSQPTVVGAYPASNGVCTLTKIETITPACAVANATYGQSGSGAVVSALTLNTSPIEAQSGIVSTTSIYVPNPGGRATYKYAPGSHIGVPGLVSSSLAFATAGSATTTVPTVVGTINLAPGVMNYVGRTLEICGKWDVASGDTSTVISTQFQWDSMGKNTAGKGVQIGTLTLTPATAVATAVEATFCEDFQTTAVGATATGGSINTVGGFIATNGVAAAAAGLGAGTDPTVGTTASLNLAADARINIIHLHTTSVGGVTPVLQALTVKVIN